MIAQEMMHCMIMYMDVKKKKIKKVILIGLRVIVTCVNQKR